jgi:hypothetical protein
MYIKKPPCSLADFDFNTLVINIFISLTYAIPFLQSTASIQFSVKSWVELNQFNGIEFK